MQNAAINIENPKFRTQISSEELLNQHSTGTPGVIVPDPVPVNEFQGVDSSVEEDSQYEATSALASCREDGTGRYRTALSTRFSKGIKARTGEAQLSPR